MDKRIVTHVFAALQSLEKCHGKVRDMLPEAGESRAELESAIPQQSETLTKMRRTANHLQLELAREDWVSAVRSLRIFYGLNHLIRRDVLKAHSRLVGVNTKYVVTENAVEVKAPQYH